MKALKEHTKLSIFIGLMLIMVLAVTPIMKVLADNVINNVAASVAFTAGQSTTVDYWIEANNGDGQTGCNASDTTPATLTFNTPAGVTASPESLTFTACKDKNASNSQEVTFTAAQPGSFDITVNVADTGAGTYGTNSGEVTLNVSPASDTTPPVITPTVTGTLGLNGWYVSDVIVSWSVVDNESAITSTTGCETTTISADTVGTTLTCAATSTGGTASQSVTIKRDATKPIITATLDKTAATTGWYNLATGTPTVSFKCEDNLSGLDGACPAAYTFLEGAGQSYSKTVSDLAGNTSAPAGFSGINVDTTSPTITATLDKAAATTGWYNIATGAPTVSFKCTDEISGIAAGACPAAYTFPEGAGQSYFQTVSDQAGNTAVAAGFSGINVDLTAPALNITGSPAGASDVCSALPTKPTYAPSDATSGIAAGSSESWTPASSQSGVGTYIYTATAEDNAGNKTSETRTYSVTYGSAFVGFSQPINMNGSSRFKLGSTVPVKFQMMCGTTPIQGVVANLYVGKVDPTADSGVDEAISTAASTTGNLFRYDSTAQQYIFNLSTKLGYLNPNGTTAPFSTGTWMIKALLDDGTARSVNIQLPK